MTKAHTKSSTVFIREAVYNNAVTPYNANFVDVRDVAKLHVEALKNAEKISGERIIAANDEGCQSTTSIGAVAQKVLPHYKMATPPKYSALFIWIMLMLSYLPIIGSFFLNEVERIRIVQKIHVTNLQSRKLIDGFNYRPIEETVKDGAVSIIEGGWAKPKKA